MWVTGQHAPYRTVTACCSRVCCAYVTGLGVFSMLLVCCQWLSNLPAVFTAAYVVRWAAQRMHIMHPPWSSVNVLNSTMCLGGATVGVHWLPGVASKARLLQPLIEQHCIVCAHLAAHCSSCLPPPHSLYYRLHQQQHPSCFDVQALWQCLQCNCGIHCYDICAPCA
jgi:hypothetical protein